MAGQAIAVELPQESWETVQALLIHAALRYTREGEDELAGDVLEYIFPFLDEAAGTPILRELQARVRAEVGLPTIGERAR